MFSPSSFSVLTVASCFESPRGGLPLTLGSKRATKNCLFLGPQTRLKGAIAHRGDGTHHRGSFHKTFGPLRRAWRWTFRRHARSEYAESFCEVIMETPVCCKHTLVSIRSSVPSITLPLLCREVADGLQTLSVSNAVRIGVNVAWPPPGVPQVCYIWPSPTLNVWLLTREKCDASRGSVGTFSAFLCAFHFAPRLVNETFCY